jgi:hypothetical protein
MNINSANEIKREQNKQSARELRQRSQSTPAAAAAAELGPRPKIFEAYR